MLESSACTVRLLKVFDWFHFSFLPKPSENELGDFDYFTNSNTVIHILCESVIRLTKIDYVTTFANVTIYRTVTVPPHEGFKVRGSGRSGPVAELGHRSAGATSRPCLSPHLTMKSLAYSARVIHKKNKCTPPSNQDPSESRTRGLAFACDTRHIHPIQLPRHE